MSLLHGLRGDWQDRQHNKGSTIFFSWNSYMFKEKLWEDWLGNLRKWIGISPPFTNCSA